jgi:hypothetical protein
MIGFAGRLPSMRLLSGRIFEGKGTEGVALPALDGANAR